MTSIPLFIVFLLVAAAQAHRPGGAAALEVGSCRPGIGWRGKMVEAEELGGGSLPHPSPQLESWMKEELGCLLFHLVPGCL